MKPAIATAVPGNWGYLALFNGQRAEIWTDRGIFAAREQAAALMKVKPRDRYKIAIMPTTRPNGTEVTHTADF